MKDSDDRKDHDVVDETGRKIGETNPDPITGEPGSHPVGTGIGAASAGAVGAAIGAVAGPVGALAGAAIGSVVGGLAGHGIAEAIDPTAEEAYWREEYHRRPYYKEGHTYDDYAPAYRLGIESRVRQHRNPVRSFENIESDVGATWDDARGGSRLAWDDARPAVQDAWHRTGDRLTSASGAGPLAGVTRGPDPAGLDADPALLGTTGAGAQGATRDVRTVDDTGSTFDSAYYRESFSIRAYCTTEDRYEEFEPAYRYGHQAMSRYPDRRWEDVEADLGRDWERNRGTSSLGWERAKLAVRDAWNRMRP